ncbi:MAG: nicotinate-nucleotide adenylyltransferase [Bacteroidales bacterium]|nr:nicotinate-nucleotide adenylyltransferase [Bacteroidales bacterium]
MEIGFFGGSFNPIHIGHLVIAEYLCNNTGIDELWISVTPKNPLKADSSLLDEKHRIEMMKRAIEHFDKIKYCDIELSLPIPSYTANTLRELCKRYPEHNFSLIIGADNWVIFDKWREYDFILKNFKIIIYPRPGYDIDKEALPNGVTLCNTPEIGISSTMIRDSFKCGKPMLSYTTKEVSDYIIEKNLFI